MRIRANGIVEVASEHNTNQDKKHSGDRSYTRMRTGELSFCLSLEKGKLNTGIGKNGRLRLLVMSTQNRMKPSPGSRVWKLESIACRAGSRARTETLRSIYFLRELVPVIGIPIVPFDCTGDAENDVFNR